LQIFYFNMQRKICILGSTGIIGRIVLDIIKKKKFLFKVYLLSANKNYLLLKKQIKTFNPKFIYTNNLDLKKKIETICKKKKIKIINDISKLKGIKFDYTISSISGYSGLLPTLQIIKFTKNIGIINKESIICGWRLIENELLKHHCNFTPLDSEHYSIFTIFDKINSKNVDKIFITASGGPFFNRKLSAENFTNVVKHPVWKMGIKNSIDSATLVNKVLEVIETSLIFSIPINKISVLIHPQALIHSLISLKNHTTLMVGFKPNMEVPLTNFLYNKNNDKNFFKSFDNLNINFKKKFNLDFYNLDKRYTVIKKIIKYASINKYNSYIAINIINEVLVENYIKKKIKFVSIPKKLFFYLNKKRIVNLIKNTKIRTFSDIDNFVNNLKNEFN